MGFDVFTEFPNVFLTIAAAVDTRVPRRTGRLVLRGRGGGAVPLHGPKLWLTQKAHNPLVALAARSPDGKHRARTAKSAFRMKKPRARWAGPGGRDPVQREGGVRDVENCVFRWAGLREWVEPGLGVRWSWKSGCRGSTNPRVPRSVWFSLDLT